MLETENWHVSTYPYVVSENIPFSTKAFLILLMSAFFCKEIAFFDQNSTFTHSNESCVRDNLVLFYRLCVWNSTSRLLQICHKLKKWQWRHNFPTWHHRHIFLTRFCFSCQVYLLVQVLCIHYHWLWSYDSFLL